jgi:hypothetical protein
MMGQTKNDTLVFQVDGGADGLVTPYVKINIYSHFAIPLTRADVTRKTGSETRDWKRCGTYKKEMSIAKLEQVKGLALVRKMMMMMVVMMMMMMMVKKMMMITTTIRFGL